MNPLISIITPCYNGEKFVARYFESILNQTYSPIELIFVNDGSNDETEQIVNSYRTKLEQKNILFHYIYQENKGQAASINRGLSIFHGEYLTWLDSDDVLPAESLEKKVNFLEQNKGIASVFSKITLVEENNLQSIIKVCEEPESDHKKLFMKYLQGHSDICAGYVVRSSAFKEINPKLSIYESRAGQNWQMFLPMLYYFPCGYLDESLYSYIKRSGSESRRRTNLPDILDKISGYEDILIHVIKGMGIPEEKEYLDIVNTRYCNLKKHVNEKYKDGVY